MSSSANLINIGSGWFDAFRDNGGPVLYSSMNRTPAIEDIRNILIYISFSTFFVAFLIIFPGIRKEVGDFFLITIENSWQFSNYFLKIAFSWNIP